MISFLLSCPQPHSSCGTGMGREPVFSPFLLCLPSVSAIEFVQEGGTGVSCQAGATFLAEEWTFCSLGARETPTLAKYPSVGALAAPPLCPALWVPFSLPPAQLANLPPRQILIWLRRPACPYLPSPPPLGAPPFLETQRHKRHGSISSPG